MKLSRIKKLRQQIPPCAFTCKKDCHECCGPTMMTASEWRDIKAYMAAKKIAFPINADDHQVCPLYDPKRKRCGVYPVRPLICRLFGLEAGCLECSYFRDKVRYRYMEFSPRIIRGDYHDSLVAIPEIFGHFDPALLARIESQKEQVRDQIESGKPFMYVNLPNGSHGPAWHVRGKTTPLLGGYSVQNRLTCTPFGFLQSKKVHNREGKMRLVLIFASLLLAVLAAPARAATCEGFSENLDKMTAMQRQAAADAVGEAPKKHPDGSETMGQNELNAIVFKAVRDEDMKLFKKHCLEAFGCEEFAVQMSTGKLPSGYDPDSFRSIFQFLKDTCR